MKQRQRQKPKPISNKTWLQTGSPPRSYKIQLAYVDTKERYRPGTLASDDSYSRKELMWIDTPERFPNYAQANLFALQTHSPALFQITGSNLRPDKFIFQSYQTVEPKIPVMTPELADYLALMKKINSIPFV